MYIQTFCEHVNILAIFDQCEHLNVLHIFDQTDLLRVKVRLELNGSNARLIVSPPSLSPSHPRRHRQSRWPALTTLFFLAKF